MAAVAALRHLHMLVPLILLIAAASSPTTAPTDLPTYRCTATKTPIQIDGRFDDAAWSAAAWTSDFCDVAGRDRPAPPHRTRAKLAWDGDHLYVAAELAETDVRATLREHDDPLYRENAFELFLDPDGDGQNYLELEVNALGTVFDLLMSRPYRQRGRANSGFDVKGLKCAVRVDGTINDDRDRDRAWTVELAIPWSSLAQLAPDAAGETTTPKPGDRWRANLTRMMYTSGQPKPKHGSWSPIGVVDFHVPDRWGWIELTAAAEPAASTPARK